MRKLNVLAGFGAAELCPNTTAAEVSLGTDVSITNTGFATKQVTNATYIYMAIRRGPMRTPTDGTKVFQPVVRQGSGTAAVVNTTITPDLVVHKARGLSSGVYWLDRLRDDYHLFSDSTNGTAAEAQLTSGWPVQMWDNQTGYDIAGTATAINSTSYSYIDWVFKRAPGFFDVVCYTGTGAARTVNHNLGVAPELMIVKSRTSTLYSFNVYAIPLGNTKELYINLNGAAVTNINGWNSTSPTTTQFTVGTDSEKNASGGTYVAYLFASCPGVSKVGSYTGNGSSQTINCGFSNGARFVLIKRTDSTGDWYVWDTARGIVASTDPYLSLNTTAAEVTTNDTIDPDASGFIVNQVTGTNANWSGATYIYLAIA